MASEIRNRFTDTEMQIARETDLPELLSHLGYQVKRVGRFHTTAEMDSLRIKDRRTWFRYSQNTGRIRHYANGDFAIFAAFRGYFVEVCDIFLMQIRVRLLPSGRE